MDSKSLNPNIFARPLVWDWSKQRWRGCYLSRAGSGTCSYFDLSDLRSRSAKNYYCKDEFTQLLRDACLPDAAGTGTGMGETHCSSQFQRFKQAFCTSSVPPEPGDIIQIGKSKNRGMFIVGDQRVMPITQVLGGNGFGEIPFQFAGRFPPNYWTIQGHALVNIIPVLSPTKTNSGSSVKIGQSSVLIGGDSLYAVCDGVQWDHVFFYVDQNSHEFFSLPKVVSNQFHMAEKQILDKMRQPAPTPTKVKVNVKVNVNAVAATT